MAIIDLYCKASNARLNHHKSLAVSLNGKVPEQWRQVFASHHITQWHDRHCTTAATYLGFPLNSSHMQLKQFLESRLKHMQGLADRLQSRRLSIRGKALVANSLLLSRMWYCLRILPLTQHFLESIQSTIMRFLQGKSIPLVGFTTCARPKAEGGLGIINPKHHIAALQLRWLLPLLSCDNPLYPPTLADPYLRFCLQFFCDTFSPIIPILFPERRTHLLQSLGHFKMLFQAADKLQLNIKWNQVSLHTVFEFPLLKVCTYEGPNDEPPKVSWRNLLVRDVYVLDPQLRRCRARTLSERRSISNRNRVVTFLKDIDTHGAWSLKVCFRRLLLFPYSSTPSPYFDHAFHRLLARTTHTGLDLVTFTRKQFRYSLLIPFHQLPSSYPRASKSEWRRFWSAPFPHRIITVLWRLHHRRIPCRARLHHLAPTIAPSPLCHICQSANIPGLQPIEDDKHFFFSCPFIQPFWRRLFDHYIPATGPISWDHIKALNPSHPSAVMPPFLSFRVLVACGVWAVWRCHWDFIYQETPINEDHLFTLAYTLIERFRSQGRFVRSPT